MKKITTLLILLVLIFTLVACSGNTAGTSSALDIAQAAIASDMTNETTVTNQQIITATVVPVTVKYDSEDLETNVDTSDMTIIMLDGNDIIVQGEGATVNGSSVTVTAAGTYQISGTLTDGQIIVDTADAENVTLVLDGVDITSQTSAPIYVANAEKVIMILAAGSENIVTDGDTYLALDESGEPNATIFSKDDLTINGEGALIVNANYNNGIVSKDDLNMLAETGIDVISAGALTHSAVFVDISMTINPCR